MGAVPGRPSESQGAEREASCGPRRTPGVFPCGIQNPAWLFQLPAPSWRTLGLASRKREPSLRTRQDRPDGTGRSESPSPHRQSPPTEALAEWPNAAAVLSRPPSSEPARRRICGRSRERIPYRRACVPPEFMEASFSRRKSTALRSCGSYLSRSASRSASSGRVSGSGICTTMSG